MSGGGSCQLEEVAQPVWSALSQRGPELLTTLLRVPERCGYLPRNPTTQVAACIYIISRRSVPSNCLDPAPSSTGRSVSREWSGLVVLRRALHLGSPFRAAACIEAIWIGSRLLFASCRSSSPVSINAEPRHLQRRPAGHEDTARLVGLDQGLDLHEDETAGILVQRDVADGPSYAQLDGSVSAQGGPLVWLPAAAIRRGMSTASSPSPRYRTQPSCWENVTAARDCSVKAALDKIVAYEVGRETRSLR